MTRNDLDERGENIETDPIFQEIQKLTTRVLDLEKQIRIVSDILALQIKSNSEIFPSKNRKVCANCKYFEYFNLHSGVCYQSDKMKPKIDTDKCKKFEKL